MQSHEIDYEIIGDNLQALVVTLPPSPWSTKTRHFLRD